jgi:hypothetical protein
MSLTRSHDRLEAKEPGRRRPVKAASRRSRSRAARALMGVRRSGSGAPSGHGLDPRSIGRAKARGARSAMQSFGSECISDRGSTAAPRVVPSQAVQSNVQTNTCDQNRPAAPRGFYLAIARSAVCAPPILRCPSPNCDQTKTRSRISAALSVQVRCSLFGVRTCVMCCRVDGKWDAGAAAAVPVVCRTSAGRAQEGGKQTGLSCTW